MASPATNNILDDGPMATEPALTVGGIMAAISAVVGILTAFGYVSLSAEQQTAINEHGPKLIAAAIAIYGAVQALVQAKITRERVFAPASLAEATRRSFANGVRQGQNSNAKVEQIAAESARTGVAQA